MAEIVFFLLLSLFCGSKKEKYGEANGPGEPSPRKPIKNTNIMPQKSLSLTRNYKRSTRLAKTYYELLKSCHKASGGGTVTPSAIKNAVSRTVSQFSGYG